MRSLIAAVALAAMPLAGCATTGAPIAAADKTVLDERLALGVETAYAGARVALEAAVDNGYLKGENAASAARLNREAYAAVKATRTAYAAGNAADYASAAALAALSVSQMLEIAR